jgi:hypothetical protein
VKVGTARFDVLKEMRATRGYMDLTSYVDAFEDYLSEYICKDEVSVHDCVGIFEKMVRESDEGGDLQNSRHEDVDDTAQREADHVRAGTVFDASLAFLHS